MQGKGLSLRLSLVTVVVVLIFGTLGGFSLARDAFDTDYDDCPAATRLGAIDGLTIDRTDEDDEIRVSWEALDGTSLSSLGPNGYRARLTVIVDGEDARNVALGDTNLVVGGINFAEDLTVSVAVTLGDYVISDIAEADFTSGMPAPRFTSDVFVSANAITNVEQARADDAGDRLADKAEFDYWRKTLIVLPAEGGIEAAELATAAEQIVQRIGPDTADADARQLALAAIDGTSNHQPTGDGAPTQDLATAAGNAAVDPVIDGDDEPVKVGQKVTDLGTFYYLGFNDLFDNWYIDSRSSLQSPRTPKFRVGLRHGAEGLEAEDADFENYRIVIEDSSGDLLGYQAETVDAKGTYGGSKIVFGDAAALLTTVQVTVKDFSNIRLSNKVTENGALLSPYFSRTEIVATNPLGRNDIALGNIGKVDAKANVFPPATQVYADAPVEYYDFPEDVFESDGSYTIKAWAEDGDGTRISPQASIVLGAQEQEPHPSTLIGYSEADDATNGLRLFTGGVTSLKVYGFSIQDE